MRRFRPHQEVSPVKMYLSALLTVMVHLTVCTAALAESYELVVRSRPMLHTLVEIKAWGPGAGQAIEEAFAEMERVNSLLNNYDPQSEVSAINMVYGTAGMGIRTMTASSSSASVASGRRVASADRQEGRIGWLG